MKPFDLEAAKRGEPIEGKSGRNLTWVGVRFVGVMTNGWIAVEYGGGVDMIAPQYARMAEKPKGEKFVYLYLNSDSGVAISTSDKANLIYKPIGRIRYEDLP